jgi:hypothetical protein
VIKPEDYSFVAIIFHGEDFGTAMANAEERSRLRKHMEHTGGKFSTHAHGGTCHICGAWAATVAYFHHHPSNSYIVTGETCCGKLEDGHEARFRVIRDEANAILHARAGKMKAKGLLKEVGLEAAWDVYENENSPTDKHGYLLYEERTVKDIVSKLVKYGSISEKAESFMRSLLERIEKRAEIEAERAKEAERASPVPVTEDRIEVTGEVLSTKWEAGFGYNSPDVLKVLIKHETGYKLWGTAPKKIATDLEKGDTIKFMAKVEPSKDDPKFGFFKRPTKAEKLRAA